MNCTKIVPPQNLIIPHYNIKFLFKGFLPTNLHSGKKALWPEVFVNYDVPGMVPAIMSTVLQLGGLT